MNKRLRGFLVLAVLCFAGAVFSQTVPKSQPQTAPRQTQPASPLDIHVQIHSAPVDGRLKDDPSLRELIVPYEAEVDKRIKEVIGSADREIAKGLAGGLLGNFVTDAMRAESEAIVKRPVDLAIQNSGGLRNPIPEGPITAEVIYRLMPFENEIYVLSMSGEQVSQLLEFMASKMQGRGGDALSGARIVVEQGKLVSAEIRGGPINPSASYLVAVSDYLYDGGSGYRMLAEIKNPERINLTLRDAIIHYIKRETAAGRAIRARLDGRIKVLSETPPKSAGRPQAVQQAFE